MNLHRRWLVVGIIMGFIILLVFIGTFPDGKNLTVVFCDVGQGDATYLRFPNGQDMLIDGGPDGSVLACLGKVMPFWDRSLDVVVITHPEKDHFGGIIQVVERFHIGMLIVSGIENTSVEYQHLVKRIQEKALAVRTLSSGDQIVFHSVVLSWLWPTHQYRDEIIRWLNQNSNDNILGGETVNKNDLSQVILLDYNNIEIIFTGDAGAAVQSQFVGQPLDRVDRVEVLKVPHHGSATGMSVDFLSWVSPAYAIISSGKRNTYGHPSPMALDMLKDFQTTIYRTDQLGTIWLRTNGNTLSITK